MISALPVMTIIGIVFSSVHLGIEAQIQCNVTRNGGNADLMCKVPSDMDIVQVTWKKRIGNSSETLMTKSKRFGVQISKPYENRLSVLQTKDPGTSAIALSQLEKEDDVCFTATFKLFPDGSLKGEVCLPKLRGVREVVCKSPADFSVTLDPPEIIIQNSELNGNIIQKGRWLNADVSPVCNFQLRQKARTRRIVQDQDEIFTIECNASGTQRPTITWTHEGRPISKEEKVIITGDLITVTSTRHHSSSTLPKGEATSCIISYDKESHHEKNEGPSMDRIIIVSIAAFVLLSVVFCVMLCNSKRLLKNIFKRKQLNSSKKEDKAKEEQHNPVMCGTPGSETKRLSQKKKYKCVKRLFKGDIQ